MRRMDAYDGAKRLKAAFYDGLIAFVDSKYTTVKKQTLKKFQMKKQ
tara:strand:- start:310 stop:447 length:138 start_codon:yes stop_codon:yes gene_type:complete